MMRNPWAARSRSRMIFGFNRETGLRCNRIGKAGTELFRYGGSSDHGTLIEHDDLEARHRQIGGANKAVVPASDDDNVVHKSHLMNR